MNNDFVKLMREKYKDRKIIIAYPSPEHTPNVFNTALMELVLQNSIMFNLGLTNSISSRIAVNRNNIVEQARALKGTDILWLDSDMCFPVNGLIRLLMHDKPIVCATARRRNSDGAPVGISEAVGEVSRLTKMKLIGFPFMLTKMEVFDKMEKPYFAEPPRKMLSTIDTMQDEVVGEDEYFCYHARKAGYDIWCDMELSLEIGHYGSDVKYIAQDYVRSLEPPKVDMAL